jgi:hypothetical protein
MKKWVWAVSVIVLMSVSSISLEARQRHEKKWIKAAKKRSVRVVNTATGSFGAGIVIAPSRVLTARDIMESPMDELTDDDLPAITIGRSKQSLLMMLATETEGDDTIPIPCDHAKVYEGQKVFFVGPYLGHRGCVVKGSILKIEKVPETGQPLYFAGFSPNIAPGSVASGIYNEKGRLIGIAIGLEGLERGGGFLTVILPVRAVEDFLKEQKTRK